MSFNPSFRFPSPEPIFPTDDIDLNSNSTPYKPFYSEHTMSKETQGSKLRGAMSKENLGQQFEGLTFGEGTGEGGDGYGSPKAKNPATNIHFIKDAPTTLQLGVETATPRTRASAAISAALHATGATGHRREHSKKLPEEFNFVPKHVIDTANRPSSPLHSSLLTSLLSPMLSPKPEPQAAKPVLSFPELKPRGPGLNINVPALPTSESPTKIYNGVVMSRDQIRRIKQLYTEPRNDLTYWKISQFIGDEYGVIISSMTIYECLKGEGLLPTVKKQVPGDATQGPHEEEVPIDFTENLLCKTKIVEGMVVSQDIENRLVRLWDQGKREVNTLRMFILDEYGTKLPVEVVQAMLKETGRNVKFNI